MTASSSDTAEVKATTKPRLGRLANLLTQGMDEATVDALIERASRPRLASLIEQGKEAGLIETANEYDPMN